MTWVSSSTIAEVLRENSVGAETLLLVDSQYALPDAEWIAGIFAPSFHRLLQAAKIGQWAAEANDCDDFARLAAAYAGILHARTAAGLAVKCGLAFGEIVVWHDAVLRKGHALNLFVSKNDAGALGVKFFEPQTQQIVTLAEDETYEGYYIFM
jgi:hypothetical protein